MRLSPVVLLVLAFCLCGCGGGGGITPVLTTITVSPSSVTVPVGGTQPFTATGHDQGGNTMACSPTWSCVGGIGTMSAGGVFSATTEGSGTVRASQGSVYGEANITVSATGTHNLTNLFFLHHSVGDGLITAGNMRGVITDYNTAHSTSFAFWDHGYNADGLRDAAGNPTGTDYAIPGDNTDPEGLYLLWTSAAGDWTYSRDQIMNNHQVIAFKSCFTASEIPDNATLQQYQTWYLEMRDYFDAHPEKLFVVMSMPPQHRLATTATPAANARAFANWLSSSTYLSGHPNVVCFNLFDYLAEPADAPANANMLQYEYEGSHSDSDSHPNALGNQTVGPILAQFLINAALAY